MFKFEDVIVGTKGHNLLLDRLGDLSGAGKEVHYEEYVTNPGVRESLNMSENLPHQISPDSPNRIVREDIMLHAGREVKCRGHAIP